MSPRARAPHPTAPSGPALPARAARRAPLRAVLFAVCALLFAEASAQPREPVDPALLRRLAVKLLDERTNGEDRFDLEVWLHSVTPKLSRYMRVAAERDLLIASVHREAARNRIDPDLVLAVIEVESRFDRFAVSRAGAQGVMQIMPFWKQELGRPQDNLIKIDTNIRYGTIILAHYIERSNGDIVQALARYNGSHGLLNYPERVLAAWRRRWQSKPVQEIPELLAGCDRYRLVACDR